MSRSCGSRVRGFCIEVVWLCGRRLRGLYQVRMGGGRCFVCAGRSFSEGEMRWGQASAVGITHSDLFPIVRLLGRSRWIDR